MELKDLVGVKKITGVDFETKNIKREYGDDFEDCQCVNFVLDRKTYTAIEDPSDGYRSNMREIRETKTKVKNIFEPIEVLARMRESNSYQKDNILELLSLKNGAVVFEVGTANTDDYYPYWVAKLYPENLSV